MGKERVHAGLISKKEMLQWRQQMNRDGFTALWTWVCWVVRKHLKEDHE